INPQLPGASHPLKHSDMMLGSVQLAGRIAEEGPTAPPRGQRPLAGPPNGVPGRTQQPVTSLTSGGGHGLLVLSTMTELYHGRGLRFKDFGAGDPSCTGILALQGRETAVVLPRRAIIRSLLFPARGRRWSPAVFFSGSPPRYSLGWSA